MRLMISNKIEDEGTEVQFGFLDLLRSRGDDPVIELPEYELAEHHRIGRLTLLESLLSSGTQKEPEIYRRSVKISLGEECKHVYFRRFSHQLLCKINDSIDKNKLNALLHTKIYPICVYNQSSVDVKSGTGIDDYLSGLDHHKLFFAFINNSELLPSGEYHFPVSEFGILATIRNNLELFFNRHQISDILKKIRSNQPFNRREILFILSIFNPRDICID